MTVVADGHALELISDRVVHCHAGHCHQYFTLDAGRVVACDGVGWADRSAPTWVSQRVEAAVKRLLKRGG